MVSRRAILSRIFACLILLAATVVSPAKTHEVTIGMRIEDALLVVKQCLVEATAFNAFREKEKYKQLRAEDTLEYAGITDSFRMNAFRRFVVRNTEIGVQSIWGVRDTRARPYFLTLTALDGVKKSMKIEEVARIIVKGAGLPFLSYGTATTIVSKCRWSSIQPNVPVAATTIIGPEKRVLVDCLKAADSGVGSVGVISGEGDYFPYVGETIDACMSAATTYGSAVQCLYDKATVAFEGSTTAYFIFPAEVLREAGCRESSFPLATWCKTDPNLRNAAPKPLSKLTIREVEQRSGVSSLQKQVIPPDEERYRPSKTDDSVKIVDRVSGIVPDPESTLGELRKIFGGRLD